MGFQEITMKGSSCIFFALCVLAVANGIPFRPTYDATKSKPVVDGYLQRLSSNYLRLLKSFISQKYQHGSASKRSMKSHDDLMSNDIEDLVTSANEKKAVSSRDQLIDGYIRRISSNYLRMIRDYLEKQPEKPSSKREKNVH